MSDERPDEVAASSKPSESQVAPPVRDEMTRAERIFVRINIVQTILAVAGVFTGAVALYAALNESAAVRRQSEAAVWPIIQLYVSDFANQDSAEFKVSLNNTGVGPARMKSMRVRMNGVAAKDWREALRLATGADDTPFAKSYSVGRVIAAGETADIFSVNDRASVEKLSAAAASGAAQIDYCYCSIFNACWLQSSDEIEAEPVKTCPDFGREQFQE